MTEEKDLKYVRTHEWIEPAGTRRRVGISAFATAQLGEVVFVDFPHELAEVTEGEEVAVIESTKATVSVYSPVAGRLTSFNNRLTGSPELINQDPYGAGWLFEIEPAPAAEDAVANELMNSNAYKKFCEESEE